MMFLLLTDPGMPAQGTPSPVGLNGSASFAPQFPTPNLPSNTSDIKLFVAIYDFAGLEPGDLPLKKVCLLQAPSLCVSLCLSFYLHWIKPQMVYHKNIVFLQVSISATCIAIFWNYLESVIYGI